MSEARKPHREPPERSRIFARRVLRVGGGVTAALVLASLPRVCRLYDEARLEHAADEGWLGQVAFDAKDYADSIPKLRARIQHGGEAAFSSRVYLGMLVYSLTRLGDADEADAIIARCKDPDTRWYLMSWKARAATFDIGRKKALAWLESHCPDADTRTKAVQHFLEEPDLLSED
jgi:hypothetical protein